MKVVWFLFRQVYRIVIVWPWVALCWCRYVLESMCVVVQREKKNDKPWVIVTSVIKPTMKRLSYAQTRSVYAVEERVRQTQRTIQSIRQYFPGVKILLLEAGVDEGVIHSLAALVERSVYIGDHRLVRVAVDSRFKSIGEAIMLLVGWQFFSKDAPILLKMSGRYCLTDQFDLQKWGETKQMVVYPIRDQYISTRLYGVPRALMRRWRFALRSGLALGLLDYPIEHTLARYMPTRRLKILDVLGVHGADATTGNEVKE